MGQAAKDPGLLLLFGVQMFTMYREIGMPKHVEVAEGMLREC